MGSGVGRDYLEGLEERLAPLYARAGQELEIERRQAERQRFQHALDLQAQQTAERAKLGLMQEELALGAGAGRISERERQQFQYLDAFLDRGLTMTTEELRVNHEGLMQAMALQRNISVEEMKQIDKNFFDALSMLSDNELQKYRIMLDSAETATERQQMYTDIPLMILAENRKHQELIFDAGMARADSFWNKEEALVNTFLRGLENWAATAGQTSGGFRGTGQN